MEENSKTPPLNTSARMRLLAANGFRQAIALPRGRHASGLHRFFPICP